MGHRHLRSGGGCGRSAQLHFAAPLPRRAGGNTHAQRNGTANVCAHAKRHAYAYSHSYPDTESYTHA